MSQSNFKIFEIGFNKCATRAVTILIRSAGIPSRHWVRGDLARDLKSAIEHDATPFENYKGVRFFSDIVYADVEKGEVFEGYKHFKFLFKKFPDAKFVYNLRPKDAWLKSRAKHGDGFELNIYRAHLGLTSDEAVMEAWSTDWDNHLSKVKMFFEQQNAQDRLLFINIDDPNFDEISSFIEAQVDINEWQVVGKTKA